MVDTIISGIGSNLLFDGPLKLNPALDNPTICQDAVRMALTAARNCCFLIVRRSQQQWP